jgi:hypothetical protein
MIERDREGNSGIIATDGLGAVMTCFGELTSTRKRPELTRAVVAAPVAVATSVIERAPARRFGVHLDWRRRVGAYLIALGERLATVPAVGAAPNG